MRQCVYRLLLFLGFLIISSHAFSFEVNGINYEVTSETDLTVEVSHNNYSGDIVIPENVEYNGKTYSVTFIGIRAFRGCSDLTSVTIPNGVYAIGGFAFSDCVSLTSVTIPNSVIGIEYCAFKNCVKLTSITSLNTQPPEIAMDTFDRDTQWHALLLVPIGCANIYRSQKNWQNFGNIQEIDTSSIEELEDDSSSSQPHNNGVIYNLRGERINTSNANSLSKGIYIINGKKVFIK